MARLIICIALAALASASPAAADQIEPDIIGHGYLCKAKVAMPLPSSDLEGSLTIFEDGTRHHFSAQLYGMKVDSDPVGWSTAETLRRLGLAQVVRWDMSWSEEGREIPLSFGAGYISIEVSTPRELEVENVLVLARDAGSEPLIELGERFPGKTNGAGFLFEISDLLAFADKSDTLRYRLFSAPQPRDWRTSDRRLRAAGTVDLAGPRSVGASFARLRAELLAKAEDRKNACERRPIYYVGDTEI